MKDLDLELIAHKLDKISNAFCLAKYDLFTLHLHLGAAHSCHLTSLKKLDANLINGPYDFFNFPEIKEIRKKMKDGIKDDDCRYCWKIEENNNKYSDRHIQSTSLDHSYDKFVLMDPLKDDVIPSYLEVSFSNLCNLKCTYCNDNFSSKWESDIKKYGDYINSTNITPKKAKTLIIKENNPFLEKFKLYFPEILKNLYFLRITGGEPLLHDELYEILDHIKENPQKNLYLCINTNLCSSHNKINKFINKLKEVENNVKRILIYTSCDTAGPESEFIREGFKYSFWKENCHRILKEIKNSDLNIMCTFNNLCLTENFKVFINDVYDMTKHSIGEKETRTFFNIQPLADPMHQSIEILDYNIFENIINEIEELINSYHLKKEDGIITSKGFLKVNIIKFKNIKNIIMNTKQNNLNNKINFLYFLNQCKIRNGKDFYTIFNDNNYRRFFSKTYHKNTKFPLNIIKNDFI
jgi:organic radical activating enzyme